MGEATGAKPGGRKTPAGEALGCSRPTFDAIVAEHAPHVSRLVRRLLGWSDDCDDVVQDVFVAVFENLHAFRGDSRLDTWIYRITVNVVRKRRRRRFAWLRVWSVQCDNATLDVRDERGESEETLAAVREAVRRLPDRLREVVVLRCFEQLPTPAVAEICGVTPNAIEVRLSRARKQLRGELESAAERL